MKIQIATLFIIFIIAITVIAVKIITVDMLFFESFGGLLKEDN